MACSSRSARPVLRMTEVTAGCAIRNRSSRETISSEVFSEVPGAVAAAMLSEPSLNSGKNDRPNEASVASAATAPTTDSAATARGARSAADRPAGTGA
jgi:hypothetical protein